MGTSKGAARAAGQIRFNRFPAATTIPIGLFAFAFAARLSALGRTVTPDEPNWIYRSLQFREALLAGDWSNTIQSGHPGITTTWIGAAAAQLQLWFSPSAAENLEWINRLYWLVPDNDEAIRRLSAFLTSMRLGVILVTSLGLVAVYLLARKRLGQTAALLGTLLLALDPFTAGLSGLLHVDALQATFMLLTMIMLLPESRHDAWGRMAGIPSRHYWQFAAAGVTTGLAVLTKSPGLFIVPIAVLLIVAQAIKDGRWRSTIRPLVLYCGALVITMLVLLPAIWANPAGTFATARDLANRLQESSTRPTYFLGNTTLTPGAGFYPVAVLFRLSPALTLALIICAGAALFRLFRQRSIKMPGSIFWLLFYSAGYLAFLNLSANRHDRYALPAMFPLALVAAWGVVRVSDGIRWRLAVPGLLVLIQLAYMLNSWPYPLTAYNWLTGGAAAAVKVLPVGWGEATSAAAARAAQQPGAEALTLSASNVAAAAPFFPGHVVRAIEQNNSLLARNDLVLSVAQDWQFRPEDFGFVEENGFPAPRALVNGSTIFELSFNGIPRARVDVLSEGDRLRTETLPGGERWLGFEGAIKIIAAAARTVDDNASLLLMVDWRAELPQAGQLILEITDAEGYVWSRSEQPLLNDYDHGAEYWPEGETQRRTTFLPLPNDLLPGLFEVKASLFTNAGERLGVFDNDGRFRGVSATIARVLIEPAREQGVVDVPNALDAGVEIVGYGKPPEQVGTGELLSFDLWFRPRQQTPAEGVIVLKIGETGLKQPLPQSHWRLAQTYRIHPGWRIPIELQPGLYPLSLMLQDGEGNDLWSFHLAAGTIEVIARDRLFELPESLEPLGVQIGSLAYLQAVDVTATGNEIVVEIIWQSVGSSEQGHSVFVHLRDREAKIVDQIDRPPSEPTDSWVPGQVIMDSFQLSRTGDSPFSIAVGLYNQATGVRLPIYGSDGRRLVGDQYVVEVPRS